VAFTLTVVFVYYQGKASVPKHTTAHEPVQVTPEIATTKVKNSLVTQPTRLSTIPPSDPKAPWVERISWAPRVFVYHNFLTSEECEQVVEIGGKDVSRSLVVAAKGQSAESEWRTSKGVFLTREYMSKSPLLRDVERRIAEWTQLPIENGEAFYLLRYENGQQYKPHHDFFSNDETGKQFIGNSGNRFATVITYLHTPEEGGDTHFPEKDIKVNAKAGDAVLFFDMNPSNDPDGDSLHAGLPVIKGVKWAMTKWIREQKTWYWKDNADAASMQKWNEEDEKFLAAKKHQ